MALDDGIEKVAEGLGDDEIIKPALDGGLAFVQTTIQAFFIPLVSAYNIIKRK